MKRIFTCLILAGYVTTLWQSSLQAQSQPSTIERPHVLLDKSPRIVAYQLKRLSNAQLLLVDRKPDDRKFQPVYEAILMRKGMDAKERADAAAALAQLEHRSPVVVLLNAIETATPEDHATARQLAFCLTAHKPEELQTQKQKLETMAVNAHTEIAQEAAYAALAIADEADNVWQLALAHQQQKEFVAGIPFIPQGAIRSAMFSRVEPLVKKAPDAATQIAAMDAISVMPGHEAEAFGILSNIIISGKGELRLAAVRSIRQIPTDKWPDGGIEPLAEALVRLVKETPAERRTGPAIAQVVQLGNDASQEMDDPKGQVIRQQLRELAVPVVVIRTLREQMAYDTRYFVVQAGKPVEVVLENSDAMPHNLVITTPGAFEEVAIAAGTMPPPADDATKAYVPDSPKVLASLSMVQPDESAEMTFTAPSTPGEYDFVCTFPGHWVRMYGVMLVVADLNAWEKSPKPPQDPLNHKPYESARYEGAAAMSKMEGMR